MAKAKAKPKAKATKTMKVRIAVIYDTNGKYQAGGQWIKGKRPSGDALFADARDAAGWAEIDLDYACIVDIELPIPKPLKGKVLKVKAVKT